MKDPQNGDKSNRVKGAKKGFKKTTAQVSAYKNPEVGGTF